MHPLDDVRSKIIRAKKHVYDFRIAAAAFKETRPCTVVIERDPETRKRVYTVTKVAPIPPELRLIAGDAIQNLRSALDYLAWILAKFNGTDPLKLKHVCFPISDSEPLTKDQKAVFSRQVYGMRQGAVDAIKRINLYKGGDDTLWRLHRLNIIDKHRLLTAASFAVSLVNPEFGAGLRDYLRNGGTIPEPTILRREPLKTGDKFSFDTNESDVYEEQQLLVEIAFNEPGISEGEPIITVLKESFRLVPEIVGDLARFV
jgi:hypothetical protein